MGNKYGPTLLIANQTFIFLCLILISLNTFAQIKKAPEWVRRIPITDDAFYGMGVVEMDKSDIYRATARKMALKEIIEKISISVSSNSELTVMYENNQAVYDLDETISIESSNYLSGHQKVGEWIDKRSGLYYVLFKLDYDVYKENRKVYFEILEDVIDVIRLEADQLLAQGEVSRGINKLTDIISRIDQETQKIVEPAYLISLQKWRLSALYELEKQVSSIGFDLESDYDFYADSQQPLIISDFIINKANGMPLSGLSTSIRVVQGDVFNHSFDHYIEDNAVGIYGLFPEKNVAIIQIAAALSLPDQIKAIIDPSLQYTFLSKPVAIRFNAYNIVYHVSNLTNGSVVNDRPVNYLTRITNDLGLIETKNQNAWYEIAISYKENVERLQNEYFDANLEVRVVVTRLHDSRELYHFTLPKVSATAKSYQSSVSKAFDRAFDQSDQFLITFVTFLCSQHR